MSVAMSKGPFAAPQPDRTGSDRIHGTMTLFPDLDDDRPPQAARLAPRLRALADQGLYFGTSSWKYQGWLGSIYSEARYRTRGKHFQEEVRGILSGQNTPPPSLTVCGDFAFYQFPSADYWDRLFAATPPGLPLRPQGPRGHHRLDLADHPRPLRDQGRGGANRHFLDAGDLRPVLRPASPSPTPIGSGR